MPCKITPSRRATTDGRTDMMGRDRVGWGEITAPPSPHFHTSLKVDRPDNKCKIIIINSRSGAYSLRDHPDTTSELGGVEGVTKKADNRKGGCETLYVTSGRGPKTRKFCGHHMWRVPCYEMEYLRLSGGLHISIFPSRSPSIPVIRPSDQLCSMEEALKRDRRGRHC